MIIGPVAKTLVRVLLRSMIARYPLTGKLICQLAH